VPRKKRRSFTQAFKQSVVARMASAETIRGLATELGIARELLFKWRRALEQGGIASLRAPGRSSKVAPTAEISAAPVADPVDLAAAQCRIAELERKIGQQQLDLDFFRAALRRVMEQQPMKGVPGGTTSTR
jgi:transposase